MTLPYSGDIKDMLRESQIGRVCNTLLQHPKETTDNKANLTKLIDRWSRAVFGQADSFSAVSTTASCHARTFRELRPLSFPRPLT